MASLGSILNIIVAIFLWLSIVGALLTILTFSIFGYIRTYPIKLIMYLCAAIAAGYTFFFFAFYSFIIDTWLCWPFAMLIHYFFLAIFCWSFCIAFNFYQMIVRRNRESENMEPGYHIASWIGPAVIVIITAALRCHGRIDHTACYINNNIARFVAFFVPGLIIISSNAVLFFFIGREIRETLADAPPTATKERRKEFRVYISIFISISLTWIFGFLMYVVPYYYVQLVFLVLFSICVPLQGFFIFGAYCFNAKVAAKWAGLFGKCIPYCRKWEEMASSTTSSRF